MLPPEDLPELQVESPPEPAANVDIATHVKLILVSGGIAAMALTILLSPAVTRSLPFDVYWKLIGSSVLAVIGGGGVCGFLIYRLPKY